LQADPERQNGCYDLKCSGFVQTHNKVVLGGSVTPASIYDGKQYGLKLTIWKVIFSWDYQINFSRTWIILTEMLTCVLRAYIKILKNGNYAT